MKPYHMLNRPDRELTSRDEIKAILKQGKFAVISMCRGDEPYIVTLSYGYEEDSDQLYFHVAKSGLKLEFIKANPQVCGTVIEDGGYITAKCKHEYRSVVFWGLMTVVESIEEKRHGMRILLNHLEPDPEVQADKVIKSEEAFQRMEVLRLEIKTIRGKVRK